MSRRVIAIASALFVLTMLLVAGNQAPDARAESTPGEGVILAAGDVAS